MTPESLEHRVLGALTVLDAVTGSRILTPLLVQAVGVQFVRNRSGNYVIYTHSALPAHAAAFAAPPTTPAFGKISVEVTIHDPSSKYLARRSTFTLPRDPAPAQAAQADSLFQLIEIPLFPAPGARLAPNWAVVQASVQSQTAHPLAGALLRVRRGNTQEVLARGLSDHRGEALVAVAGLPITTWGPDAGAVTVNQIPVTIEAIVDPASDNWTLPDPDDLERRRNNLKQTASSQNLATGQRLAITLEVDLT